MVIDKSAMLERLGLPVTTKLGITGCLLTLTYLLDDLDVR